MEKNSNKLFTIKQWAKEKNYPSEGGLRALIFNADKNGFNQAIRKIGGRILISEPDFYKWVDKINGIGGNND